VSRFSIPTDSSGENIARNFHLALHAPNERSATGVGGNDPGDRFSMFSNHDSIRIEMVEQRKALLLELGSAYFPHGLIIAE